MPRVASYDPLVAPAETTRARFEAAPYRGVAGAIGAGLQQIGGQLQDMAQVRKEIAQTEAAESDTTFTTDANDILYAPDTGFLALKGKAARDAYEPAKKALEARAREIKAKLKGDAAGLFDRTNRDRMGTLERAMQRHLAAEDRAWQIDTATARRDVNVSDAILAADDWDRSDRAIATAQDEAAEIATRKGAVDTIPFERAKVGSSTRLAIVQRLAEAEPDEAKRYLDKYSGQFTGPDLATAEKAYRIGADRQAAEGRRVIAEQKAAAAQAKSEEKERLATLEAALDTGAGTSADWRALADGYAALGDTSKSVAVRARATQVRAVEAYRSASLPEVEKRLGDLGAKSALTPDEASEQKGLEALRDQKAARLSQPGGALQEYQYASGRALAPLDARDPATYQARARIAVTAAAAAGRKVVEPLTAAEAQPLRDLVSGDSAQRLRALQSIARFGDPRAIDGAARQIADKSDGAFRIAATLSVLPGDAGFQGARDILRGPEAAKTNGGVYLPQQARAGFSSYASPALRGLSPDYSADVMDAARSLYIARMTTAGRTAWDDQAWRDSIDTALGAYRVDGVKYGGVTTFRGVAVSLPPGWTGDGVFRRIARATGPQLNSATVGRAPVWPDGSPVYSGQLRDLAPVRLGGTRYGFLTRNGRMLGAKGGGVFQLDVAKVPWPAR